MGVKIWLGIVLVVGLVVVGGVFFLNDTPQQVSSAEEPLLLDTTLSNLQIGQPPPQLGSFGLQSNGQFCVGNGLCFLNRSDGYVTVYKHGELLRSMGFGITSDQIVIGANELAWSWEYVVRENVTYESEMVPNMTIQEVIDGLDPAGFPLINISNVVRNDTTHHFVATFSGGAGTWIQDFQFTKDGTLKTEHTITNDFQNLTNTTLWYVMTVDNDTLYYNGNAYNTEEDLRLTGNFNENVPEVQFPDVTFDFSDVLEQYIVTDVYIGDGDILDYPNRRFLGIGVAGQEGGSTFPLGSTIKIDPIIEINNEEGIVGSNVTLETNYSRLNITDITPYDTLIAYYAFDVNDTSTLHDYATHNSFSQEDDISHFSGAHIINEGYHGYGGRYDGINDYTRGAADEVDGMDNNMTVMLWVYVHTEFTGNKYEGFVVRGGYDSNRGFELLMDRNDGDRDVLWIVKRDIVVTTTDLPLGEWVHLAATADGTTGKIYFNGVEEQSSAQNDGFSSTSDQLEIGRRNNFQSNVGYCNCTIDEVMVFNRTLSATEIQDIMNNQSVRFRPKGYQDFKELDATTTGDEDSINVTVDQLLHFVDGNENFTVQVGNSTAGDYVYGEEYQVDTTTGEINELVVDDPANFSLRVWFNSDSTENFYTPLLLNNITVESYETNATGGGGDTCTYGGSGNHLYECSDNCVVSTTNDYGGSNVTASGSGTLRFTAAQTNIDWFVKSNSCTVSHNGVMIG